MPPAVMTSPPPLCDGDLLDQPEFHRRYAAMPENFWAELIEGRVYLMSPAYGPHSDLHAIVDGWLMHYMARTPGVKARTTPSTILNRRNEPQPDAVLFIKPEFGGRVEIDKNGCTVGPPELVVEISVSTEARDLRLKFDAYEKAGIAEYIVVLPRRKLVRWFRLVDGQYQEQPVVDNRFCSAVFPGLWLDPVALLDEDAARILDVLDQGLLDPAHAAFVAKLKSQKSKKSRRK